jgi:hypothetical protein
MVHFFQRPVPNHQGWVPNLNPAAAYGAFSFVFDQEDRPYADPRSAWKKASARLENFDPEKDYLCWPASADVFSIYIVIAILTRKGFPKVSALVWTKPNGEEKGQYLPVEMPLNPRF